MVLRMHADSISCIMAAQMANECATKKTLIASTKLLRYYSEIFITAVSRKYSKIHNNDKRRHEL